MRTRGFFYQEINAITGDVKQIKSNRKEEMLQLGKGKCLARRGTTRQIQKRSDEHLWYD